MYSTPYRDSILNTQRGVDLTAWTAHIGLLKSITNWRTPTVVEADYTGYGNRPTSAFGAPADTSPVGGRQIANTAGVTFPQNTGASQDLIGWSKWTAVTGGICRMIALFDADPPIGGTALTSDTITAPAHGLSNNQRVFVLAVPGMAIPTGLAENTIYFVINAAANTFQLSATQGGAAVDLTADGAAYFIPFTPVTVATGATPEFAIGSLVEQL